MKEKIRTRLYIKQCLESGEEFVPEEEQIHYLCNVLRLNDGDKIAGFDGESGEFLLEIHKTGKKNICLTKIQKLRDFYLPPDLWLLFAPVKKDKTDFIIQKAGELGVRRIVPVITERTICERIKIDRYQAQVIEACEQCRRVDIPEVIAPIYFRDMLNNWDKRKLYFMDETGNGSNIYQAFMQKASSAAILVGPEGGFSEQELETLRSLPFAQGVSMGKRILRAETAVTAAIACWQAICGDWQN